MEEILSWSAFGAFLITAVIWIGKRWLDARIQRGVQARFDREAKEFEHGLALLSERERFNFQRRITDFTILVARRHEKYAELWQLMRRAHGRVIELARFKDLAFDYFDASDADAFLQKRRVPNGRREQVVHTWAHDSNRGAKLLNETLWSTVRHTARHSWVKANNYFVANQLYFSDPVVTASKSILKELDELRVVLEDPDTAESVEAHVLKTDVYKMIEEFRDVLRAELTQSDYAGGALVRRGDDA